MASKDLILSVFGVYEELKLTDETAMRASSQIYYPCSCLHFTIVL